MKAIKILLCALIAVGIGAAEARQLQLTKGSSGLWSHEDMWYDTAGLTNTLPRAGDKLTFTPFWDVAITLDQDVSMPLCTLYSSRANQVLTFHGDGHFLTSAGDAIAVNPFYLYTPGSYCWQYNRLSGDGSAWRFDNPEFVVSNVAGKSVFDFTKGTYNFYDPNGVASNGTNTLFSATNAVELVFRKDASVRFGPTLLRSTGTTSDKVVSDVALRFEGGTSFIKEILWMPYYAQPHDIVLSLTAGAHLSTDKVDLRASTVNTSGHVDGKILRPILDLSDGARLDIGAGGLKGYPDSRYVVPEVRLDHATLASDGTGSLNFTLGDGVSTNRITAVDSTIAWTNGEFSCGYFASNTKTATLGAFTNTQFVATRFCFYTGADCTFKDCYLEATSKTSSNFGNRGSQNPNATVVFDHCTISNMYYKAYPDGFISTCRFTGGTQADLLNLYLAGSADVRIDGGSSVKARETGSNRLLGTHNQSSLLTVSNATLTASSENLFLGMNSPEKAGQTIGCGTLRVQEGGNVYIGGKKAGEMSLYVGYAGYGRLEVSGGVVWADLISVGDRPKGAYWTSGEHSVLYMTGGEVHSRITDDWMGVQFGSGHEADCILDGGELFGSRIMGLGKGLSTLSANGGTIVPSRNVVSRDWAIVSGFETAELGPKGLTIDTRLYPAILNQAMSDKTGEKGLFRKIGAKTLTFKTADADWTVSQTLVADGTLQIANETMSLTGTELVTTDTGVLSVAGDSSTGGLLVGDLALSGGTVSLDDGEVITVTNSFRATAATVVQFKTTTALGAEVKAFSLAKDVTLSSGTLKALALPSATGRTTKKGRPLVGRLVVKPGANGTQDVYYTVIKQPSGFALVVE